MIIELGTLKKGYGISLQVSGDLSWELQVRATRCRAAKPQKKWALGPEDMEVQTSWSR